MNALSSLGDRTSVGVEILNPLECNGAPYQQCEKGNPTELSVERKRFQDLPCLKGEADVFLAGYHVEIVDGVASQHPLHFAFIQTPEQLTKPLDSSIAIQFVICADVYFLMYV